MCNRTASALRASHKELSKHIGPCQSSNANTMLLARLLGQGRNNSTRVFSHKQNHACSMQGGVRASIGVTAPACADTAVALESRRTRTSDARTTYLRNLLPTLLSEAPAPLPGVPCSDEHPHTRPGPSYLYRAPLQGQVSV